MTPIERPIKGAAYDTLIANREFIALDIETTRTASTATTKAETYPISIGAVVLLNGTRRNTFHTLINPGVPVDKVSSDYNGIKTADLKRAPTTTAALAALDAFLDAHPDAVVVCHNAHFDIRHLHSAYQRSKRTMFSRPVLDTEFIPIRLAVPGVASMTKLTAIRARYQVDTTVAVPKAQQRLHKALKDAQDTAEVLAWLMAEAAAKGIVDYADFRTKAKATTTDDIIASISRHHRRMRPPRITVTHMRSVHGRSHLPARPTADQFATWINKVSTCVHLHCPHIAEKTTIETRHADRIIKALTPLLAGTTSPGDAATLLLALQPLLATYDQETIRRWAKANMRHIRAAAPCDELNACPACVAGQPCPLDVYYQFLTRRALDYGLTKHGKPVSLFSRQVKDDLYDPGRWRKIDTWPTNGLPDMAAHMVWILHREAQRKRMTTKAKGFLDMAVARDLQSHDPLLALEVAKHWDAMQGHDTQIVELVEQVTAKANTDPGYLELDIWYSGPYRRTQAARAAAANKKARPVAQGKRKPAAIERRPEQVRHEYRYQLHRSPT